MPYRLTAIALEDLQRIHAYSTQQWGPERARAYIEDFYRVFDALAKAPDRDLSRRKRSHPYQMRPCGSHFIVYELLGAIVVIHAMPHQSRDVERHLTRLAPRFRKVIAAIRHEAE